jgi:hypothetical protein
MKIYGSLPWPITTPDRDACHMPFTAPGRLGAV